MNLTRNWTVKEINHDIRCNQQPWTIMQLSKQQPFTFALFSCNNFYLLHIFEEFMHFIPAAKWRGVDFRPAVSLAFTVCGVINFFTRLTSPTLQASNNSRSGSLGAGNESNADPSIERRLDMFVYHIYHCLYYTSMIG